MLRTQDEIVFTKDALSTLAIEIWRLQNITEKNDSISVVMRYSIRKLKQIVESNGISFLDFTGQMYDAGMAVDILDTEDQETDSEYIIKEMITPIIFHNGILLSHGQVILGKNSTGNFKKGENEK